MTSAGPDVRRIADIPEDGVWRRLSPRMLLIHPVREVVRFLPALLAVVFAGNTGGQHWWGLIVTAVAVGAGVARWLTTRYRFTDRQVQLRAGLIRRTTVSAPADRVRSVDVTASILHRALGLAEVKIGTAAGEKEMRLNGLTTREAAALRTDLLHRSQGTSAPVALDKNAPEVSGGELRSEHDRRAERPGPGDEELYRLDPSWVRYAPFGPSGLVAALAIFGLASQVVQDTGLDPTRSGALRDVSDAVLRAGTVIAVVVGVLVLLVVVVLLSLLAYALAFFGFRLTRSRGGETLQVTRGLLTTRAVSLETRRLRGVEVKEPIPLRWVGGARLRAVTTGLKGDDRGMSAMLAPPSPVAVVESTAGSVLGSPGSLRTPLRQHGVAARRRRWARAFGSSALVAAALLALAWWMSSWWLAVLAVLALVLAWPLAASRAAALGHQVTGRFVVGRSGALRRSTFVLERGGVVAVTTRQSLFQRRAGVCSVDLATAAGTGSYRIIDVSADRADELVDEVSGGLSRQFTAQHAH
ncbi:PH domain-containing protein [Allobranchiibius sp. CTAmp26]|uniref:PH domain-containing protein n=1 Tax=Allobranchiibius sp. CTAmp26 TaxID=2815214 RepID=UPI001AA0C313|nr:PH domain-containing protein [Allobranchiibius sp. CTAmp26]MBO1753517.1 PH domain-containing protein [Allobranchiibius sp. CTAmp26]